MRSAISGSAPATTTPPRPAPPPSISYAITTPLITGTAREGETLTASASSGQSDNPISYGWYSSADGYTTPIGTGASYVVREADERFTIEVRATATNDNGLTASQTSAATA